MSSIQEIYTEGGSKSCPGTVKDIIYTKCGDIHCTKAGSNKNQYIEPILKLYFGRPVMITKNIDVENSQANGTVGKFWKIKLKNNINDIFKIKVDVFLC